MDPFPLKNAGFPQRFQYRPDGLIYQSIGLFLCFLVNGVFLAPFAILLELDFLRHELPILA